MSRHPSPLACRLFDEIISKDPAAWVASLRRPPGALATCELIQFWALRRSTTKVKRLCAAPAESMQIPLVGPWLDQPSELLAGFKPVEAIERGQLDLVW